MWLSHFSTALPEPELVWNGILDIAYCNSDAVYELCPPTSLCPTSTTSSPELRAALIPVIESVRIKSFVRRWYAFASNVFSFSFPHATSIQNRQVHIRLRRHLLLVDFVL
jgi:hypothetical protein